MSVDDLLCLFSVCICFDLWPGEYNPTTRCPPDDDLLFCCLSLFPVCICHDLWPGERNPTTRCPTETLATMTTDGKRTYHTLDHIP